MPFSSGYEELPGALQAQASTQYARETAAEAKRNRVHVSRLPLKMQRDIAKLKRGDRSVIEEIGRR